MIVCEMKYHDMLKLYIEKSAQGVAGLLVTKKMLTRSTNSEIRRSKPSKVCPCRYLCSTSPAMVEGAVALAT